MDKEPVPFPNDADIQSDDMIQIPEDGKDHDYYYKQAVIGVTQKKVEKARTPYRRIEIKTTRNDGDEHASLEKLEVYEPDQIEYQTILSITVSGTLADCNEVIDAFIQRYGEPDAVNNALITDFERNSWLMWTV